MCAQRRSVIATELREDHQRLLAALGAEIKHRVEAIETHHPSPAPWRHPSLNGCSAKFGGGAHRDHVRSDPSDDHATHITCVLSQDRLPKEFRERLIQYLQGLGFGLGQEVMYPRCGCVTFEVYPRSRKR